MEELYESVGFKFFDNHQTFHRHEKIDGKSITREIRIDEIPKVIHRNGVVLPKKQDGNMPPVFECPILTDFIMMTDSNCCPQDFLYDVDVFTTLSAIRSLICQWVDVDSVKSQFFRKNAHFCQLDTQERLYLNTATNYTVPYEKSTSFLNKFALLGHGQTWPEYTSTSYSGIAKLRLSNGIRVAFTYRMYGQSDDQPVDLIVRSTNSFSKELDFHFLNCFLAKKRVWRYECNRNRSILREELTSRDLWNRLSIEKQSIIRDAFKNRLPDFLLSIANQIVRIDRVYSIQSVANPSRIVRLALRSDPDENLY